MTERTELYNGEIVLEFNEATHQYRVINKGRKYKVPSVTRITSIIDKSGPLIHWAINNTLEVCKGAIAPGSEYAEVYLEAVWEAAKKASQRIKQDAADRGHTIHKEIENLLSQGPEGDAATSGLNQSLLHYLLGFSGISTEKKLYSRRHRYSGTADAIARDGRGDLVLLDWKTGKGLYPEFLLQTAAYVAAYEEEHPDQIIEGRYLVHIKEDSIEPYYFPRETFRKDFAAFLGAKTLFEQVQKLEKELKKK